MAKEEAFEKDIDGNRIPVAPKDRQHTDKLQAELSMCLAAKHAVELLQQVDKREPTAGVCMLSSATHVNRGDMHLPAQS